MISSTRLEHRYTRNKVRLYEYFLPLNLRLSHYGIARLTFDSVETSSGGTDRFTNYATISTQIIEWFTRIL